MPHVRKVRKKSVKIKMARKSGKVKINGFKVSKKSYFDINIF